MTRPTRDELLESFRRKVSTGRPIIGGGAGIGLSAKCAETAGLDFIVIYNSGRYRMAGRSSMAGLMPYGDANAIVLEMGEEILEVVDHLPVLAGVCATDPFRSIPRFLDLLKDMGFAGVQNFPTVCLFEGMIRANLEETGLGFDREVAMTRSARERDLLTATYVHSVDEAIAMTEAGADILVPAHGPHDFGDDRRRDCVRSQRSHRSDRHHAGGHPERASGRARHLPWRADRGSG